MSLSLVPLDGKHAAPEVAPRNDLMVEWPLPPFQEDPSRAPPGGETASATFCDGRKHAGHLTRFSATTGNVEFLPERAAHAKVLPLTDLLELRLTRPIRLHPRRNRVAEGAGDGSDPSSRQPFSITLANGKKVEGETLGFQIHSIGLFLYLPTKDGAVRVFYPASAIREKQIGKRLGELLLDNKKVSSESLAAALGAQQTKRSQKIGELLAENQLVAAPDLLAALEKQRSQPVMRLGEALIAQGAIRPEQLEQALARQKQERGKPLGELLVDMKVLSREDLTRALTQKLGIPCVDLERFKVDRQALELVPRGVATSVNVLPLCMDGATLVVAVENPLDPAPLDRIRFLAATMVTAVMAPAEEIRRAIQRHYAAGAGDVWGASVEFIAAELHGTNGASGKADASIEAPELADERDSPSESDSALVRLVNKTIADARDAGASDIHIESNGAKAPLRIRFRQDGAMREYLTLPPTYRKPIVSRIKIMSALDISEQRKGQDGKMRFVQADMPPLELRVATVPTFDGREDVVLRLLASGAPLAVEKMNFEPKVREAVERLIARPTGLFLVCGPTGSGKSTTLHALLAHINTPDRKIWTAEDPVEIQQESLRQVQVNPKIGWTFAAAMRSFLRADPDVIMVGEMRDQETAQIGVEAALTGHTVFSTLHTNSAVESVTRLLDMGVQPFNFADSLLGVLAQRLVRRLCPSCRKNTPIDTARATALAVDYCADTLLQPAAVRAEWESRYGPLSLWHAPGCEACRNTGYKGRIGIHELLENTPRIAPLIYQRASMRDIKAQAVKDGLRTLKQDGIEKCLQGLTDLAEVRSSCN